MGNLIQVLKKDIRRGEHDIFLDFESKTCFDGQRAGGEHYTAGWLASSRHGGRH